MIVLESNRKYGQPWAAGADGDSTYVWTADTGMYAYDFLKRLSENYGYDFGTSGHDNGAIYFSEVRGENRVILEPRWLENYIVYPYTSFELNNSPSWWGFGTPPNLEKMKIVTTNQTTTEIQPNATGNEEVGIAVLKNPGDGLYFTENYIRVEKDFKYTFVIWAKNTGSAQAIKLFVDTPVKADDGLHPWHDKEFLDSNGNGLMANPFNSSTWTELHLEVFAETSGYIRPKFKVMYPIGGGQVSIDNLGLYMYKRFQPGDSYTPTYRAMDDSTTWQFTPDAKAIGGAYHKAAINDSADYLEFVIPGSKFDIISVLGADGMNQACTYQLWNTNNTLTASGFVAQYYNATSRHYSDGVDSTGLNPCVTTISTDRYGTKLPFGYYKFRIRSLNAGATTRINTVMAYMQNNDSVADTFLTGDSGTSKARVTRLSVGTNMPNLRNDILVVGADRGALVIDPGNKDSDVVNPNNPIARRIYSRATNSDSIYDTTATNYIGFQRQTIVIEPSINSKDRADWLSAELIKRHSVMRKTSSWESTGQPLLERNDKVSVIDIGKDTVDASDEFWITGMQHSLTPAKYTTSFNLTPIEPWDSYVTLPRPYIAADSDLIRTLTVKNETSSGTDVDNTVDAKYNPYESESARRIKIEFDLAMDCRIAIGIYDGIGDFDRLLTYITDQTSEDQGWTTLAAGHHTFYWDGVDQTGEYNKTCLDNGKAIGKGFYANHFGSNTFGKFYLKFSVYDAHTFEIRQFSTRESAMEQYIYTQLPAKTVFTCKEQVCKEFSTKDLYYWDNRVNISQPDGPMAPYYYPYFHEDHDQNDRNLQYLFKPTTDGRNVFWVTATVEFWRKVTAEVTIDDYYGAGSDLVHTRNQTNVILVAEYELLKENKPNFNWQMTKDLWSRDEVLEKVNFKDMYTNVPRVQEFTRDEDKYDQPTSFPHYFTAASVLNIGAGAGNPVKADTTKFYISWMVKFTFYVADKSGRTSTFYRYYPWVHREYPTAASSLTWHYFYDKGSRVTDFLEQTDGQGKHIWKGVLLETITWV